MGQDDTKAAIIDGKARAAALQDRVAAEVARLKAAGVEPGLAVVLVGEDPASTVYVRSKGRRTVEAGMASFEHRLDASASQDALLSLVARLNADPAVHGILVQLPLPRHIDEASVLAAIDPAKDVDGFHVSNAGLLATGGAGLVPCTPLGLPAAAARRAGRHGGRASGGDRAVQHRRQADGRAPAARKLHGHSGA